ncbi:hypothetical protein HHX48_16585 [Salinimonas sp. HHU 13199]|uniref:PEP-CTERM sorting domain-containing protein n=1 Tax=Salinimonas profundi TaxID=2729140 RepID=A0ABR8LPW6_9ALTE|nr:exosortase-dependent surface protein XDP1 [Salinimonas profundi]MBD3587355.1 hypothetical protein [Salinimonas profundi]
MNKFIKNVALICSVTFVPSQVMAADTIWNFNPYKSELSYDNQGFGNQITTTQNNQTLNITAWSGTDTGEIEASKIGANEWGLLNSNKIQKGRNKDSHYIDNAYSTDMLLFSFDDSVSVSGLSLGYTQNDHDLSIAAFHSIPLLTGNTWANVASQAIFTKSFSNTEFSNSNTLSFSSVATEAKYWLIGAYNANFGGDSAWTQHRDYMKLVSLTTHYAPSANVPAPASAFLFALLGLVALKRRH